MGYIEKSYGIYQALIEFTIFSPPNLNFIEKLTLFQEYWEQKNCIKTGEIENFNGWEDRFFNNFSFFFSLKSINLSSQSAFQSEFSSSHLSKFEEILISPVSETAPDNEDERSWWLETELKKSCDWRPKDSLQGVNNPESVVLFEDIEVFFKEDPSPYSMEIFNSFLNFMGNKYKFISYFNFFRTTKSNPKSFR